MENLTLQLWHFEITLALTRNDQNSVMQKDAQVLAFHVAVLNFCVSTCDTAERLDPRFPPLCVSAKQFPICVPSSATAERPSSTLFCVSTDQPDPDTLPFCGAAKHSLIFLPFGDAAERPDTSPMPFALQRNGRPEFPALRRCSQAKPSFLPFGDAAERLDLSSPPAVVSAKRVPIFLHFGVAAERHVSSCPRFRAATEQTDPDILPFGDATRKEPHFATLRCYRETARLQFF